MNIIETAIPGVLIIEPRIFDDSRGLFTEVYQAERYGENGISRIFVQDNVSQSQKGTLRGLHFQPRRPQGKLVTVLSGSVLDVVVDIRIGSPAFGQHLVMELDSAKRRQVWIPRGLAHGFIVRSEVADFFYKCDEFYDAGDQAVLRWDDPELRIDWGCECPMMSERDRDGLLLKDMRGQLPHYRKP